MADEQLEPRRRRPSRRAAAIGALAVVVLAVVVIASGAVSGSSARSGAKTKSAGTATIAVRDLVSTDTVSGTLGYADTRTVFSRLSGTITWLPPVGRVIRPGGSLFRVDGQPVVLMNGSQPAYRALQSGVSDGDDVRQLEQGLRGLGFDPAHAMTVDRHFDAATTAAVERWQARLGLTQNGQVELGRVVFLPGSRRVTSVDTGLGGTGGSGGSGSGSSNTGASYSSGDTMRIVPAVYVTTTPTATTTTPAPTTTTPTPTTPAKPKPKKKKKKKAAKPKAKKTATARGSGGGGGRSAAASGTGGGGGSGSTSASAGSTAQAVLETTSTQRVVTVALDATKQSEARVGAPVSVQLPDSSYADGHVTDVGTVATSTAADSTASGGGGSNDTTATIPVTIVLDRHQKAPHLDQAAVSVSFQQEIRRHVMSVPVTALLATAGGGFAVEVVEAGGRRLVTVQPGLFAGGYVEVSGSGLRSGMRVTDAAE